MSYEDYLASKKELENPFTQDEINSLISVESSQKPYAINKETKAMGYGQFTPETLAMLHKQGIKFDPFDKESATNAIKDYLGVLYKQTGSKEGALKAYGGFKTKDPSAYIGQIIKPIEEAPKTESLLEKRLNEIDEGQISTQKPLTLSRGAEILNRGAAPSVAGAALGSVAGPAGSLIGSMALPIGDVLNTAINKVAGTNLQMPSELTQQWMTKAGLAQPQNTTERVIESVGSALGSTAAQVPKFAELAATATSPLMKSFASHMAEAPVRQAVASVPSAAVGQLATELTKNPIVGGIAGALAGAPFGIKGGKLKSNAPSQEFLAQEATDLFEKAKTSGVEFNRKKFAEEMGQVGANLRAEGYAAPAPGMTDAFPNITHALNNLTNTSNPKDFTELQALRKMIQNAQGSGNANERRMATILKDKFDDYVLNAPKEDIISGNAEGLKTWESARGVYSKIKKAEIFDDMIQNAELDRTKFTKAGAENSLAMQLRNLAKNDKKMRLFTEDEQKAIMDAAKGSNTQNILKTISRFAPTGPLSGMFTLEAMEKIPYVGKPLAYGSVIAKNLAEQNKMQTVSNLADLMRMGQMPKVESRTKNVPVTSLRGLLSGAQ